MSTVLGFDVSSSTTAFALLNYNDDGIAIIDYGYIKPIKKDSIIERLADTRDKIKLIIEKYTPNQIVIEDIVQFMANQSSARTVITLALFNRMIGLLAYDYLGHAPELINVLSIRHTIKKQAQLTELPKKEDLPELLEKLIGFTFEWELNRKGKNKPENFDKSDSIAVAYTFIVKNNAKLQTNQ